jgi:predicted dehydrogenase
VKPLRCAIVGAGHLGKIHTRIARSSAEFELAVVVDPVEAARAAVAATHQTVVDADYHRWIDRVDAAIVATPTKFHHAVVKDFLSAGKHVFVEKPITSSLTEAVELVELARRRRCVLQVGHVERFNPVWQAVGGRFAPPRFIESRREGPFSFRSTDVGVVLDLMIHDIDLIASLVGDDVVDVEASGGAWLGKHEDECSARLRFAGGCTALVHASRVAAAPVRQMRLRTDREWATLDFQTRTAQITHIDPRLQRGEIDVEQMTPEERNSLKERLATECFVREQIEAPAADAITAEQLDFAASIRQGRRPLVSGEDGLAALRIARQVIDALAAEVLDDVDRHVVPAPHWMMQSHAAKLRREAG